MQVTGRCDSRQVFQNNYNIFQLQNSAAHITDNLSATEQCSKPQNLHVSKT